MQDQFFNIIPPNQGLTVQQFQQRRTLKALSEIHPPPPPPPLHNPRPLPSPNKSRVQAVLSSATILSFVTQIPSRFV